MKFILASENNSSYIDKITIPWDFINLASDPKYENDFFIIDFNGLIQDNIDYDFYRSAIKLINNQNKFVKLFGISNDTNLIHHFSDLHIDFTNGLVL